VQGATRISAAFALALSCGAQSARADDLSEARADYDAGAAAYDRKDYRTAAERFARADERVPNGRALQLAMAAALLASDAPLAMNLVERGATRTNEREIADLSQRLRARFAGSAGRLHFACMQACNADVDGAPVDANRPRWVAPGRHAVVLRTDAARVEREVSVRAGETVALAIDEASAPPSDATSSSVAPGPAPTSAPQPSRADRGLPPVIFWSTVALAGIGAATSTVMTIDVARRHEDFVAAPSAEASRDGEAAQTRTRIAWGVTGVLALAAVVVGLKTDFGGSSGTALRLDVGPGGVLARGRFR